jgi:hypothetical protein
MPEKDGYATELRGDPLPDPPDELHDEMGNEQNRHHHDSAEKIPQLLPHLGLPVMPEDKRLTVLLQVLYSVIATLGTGGIMWLAGMSVSTARKVDVITEKTTNIEKRVENIEQRQRSGSP